MNQPTHTHTLQENEEGGGRGHKSKADRAVTDLKTLSGGERSYTNVAFMLALGEYVEAPFRCMDEYDVVGGAAACFCVLGGLGCANAGRVFGGALPLHG